MSLLGVILSLVLLWWLFRGLPVRAFADTLRGVSPWAVLLSVGILWTSLPLRALQWRCLLAQPERVTLPTALMGVCLGYLGNLVLPARAGEVLRVYLVSRRSGITLTSVVPSIVLMRIQDVPPLLALLGIALVLKGNFSGTAWIGNSSDPAANVSIGALAIKLGLVLAAMAIVLAGLYLSRNILLRASVTITHRVSHRLGAVIERLAGDIMAALAVVGDYRRLAAAQLLAVVCWAIFSVASVPLLLAFSFSLREALVVSVVQTAVTSLAFLVPVTPGAIGTFHVLCAGVLYACVPGVSKETAAAYAVVAHLVGTLGPAIPGLVLVPFSHRVLSVSGPAPVGSDETISGAQDDVRSV